MGRSNYKVNCNTNHSIDVPPSSSVDVDKPLQTLTTKANASLHQSTQDWQWSQTLTLPVDHCRKLYIKLVIGLLVGTALEFYDFAVYSQLGKFVGPNFFPGEGVADCCCADLAHPQFSVVQISASLQFPQQSSLQIPQQSSLQSQRSSKRLHRSSHVAKPADFISTQALMWG
jgi:hypothetical protein